MTKRARIRETTNSWKLILLAGLCGGLAEVLWVTLYGSLSAVSATEVAREVTASVFPQAATMAWAPALGVAIHMALSLALGMAFAWAVWVPVSRRFNALGTLASALAVLGAVWAVNFFIILPALNPGFLKLMPLTVTFVSKLLFGAGMGVVLARATGNPKTQSVRIRST